MPKGPLLDEALTLATEAGATEVRLVRARRSPPGEPKLDRLDRVVRAAVTQCGRAAIPELRAPTSWTDALDGCPEARWLADADGDDAPPPTASPLAVAVGPEGGLDAEERALLVGAGFLPVRLGPHTLRSPTAVAAALAAGFRSFE
jgi:16S rRNA (uracil1498-N3)-methyltransferase